ncbi:hypothetical protein A9Q84_01085 [Halobacteriovorax marinus]|uniref:ABC transporter substrate-binding protein n=1 Tax=Halobacteriovorax marinus TaxID=97084 RepID=A0A1Y5FFW8_9BACT|nr:hypothetical protein A9Q84_01085 [Halobacteriovorax marinus]
MKKILLIIGLISLGIIYKVNFTNSSSKEKSKIRIAIFSWSNSKGYIENIQSFKGSLEKYGLVNNKNIIFKEYLSNTSRKKQNELAIEARSWKPNLIYSLTTPGTLIVKEHFKSIPIVFSIVTYPVEAKIIHSLKNSTNNLVGTRNYVSAETQIKLLLKIKPKTKLVGFVRRDIESNSNIQFKDFKKNLLKRGIEIFDIKAKNLNSLKYQLSNISKKMDVLYSACDTLLQSGGEELVIEHSLSNNILPFSCNKRGVRDGSLFGIVVDLSTIGSLSGEKAAKIILEKLTPSELVSESTSKVNIILNFRTLKKLKLTISNEVLSNVSEVIY